MSKAFSALIVAIMSEGSHPLLAFLMEELYSFVGEGWEQEDDITLLTLRRSAARDRCSENISFTRLDEQPTC